MTHTRPLLAALWPAPLVDGATHKVLVRLDRPCLVAVDIDGQVEPAISDKEHGRYRPIEVVGATDTRVEGLNLTLAGKPVRAPEFFKTNEFVDGLVFAPIAISQP